MHSFHMNIFLTCLKLLFFFSHIKILLSTQSCVSIFNVNAYIKKKQKLNRLNKFHFIQERESVYNYLI